MYILLFITLDEHENMVNTTGMNNAYDFNSVSHSRSRGRLFAQMLCLYVRIIIIILWWNGDDDDGGVGVSIRKMRWGSGGGGGGGGV